jgi:hypothetical protein
LGSFHRYIMPSGKTCEERVYDVAELAACRVPEDPVFPAPTEGYMVCFVAFYEREFGMPSHWFLRSLLQYYGLELDHLTPSGSCT